MITLKNIFKKIAVGIGVAVAIGATTVPVFAGEWEGGAGAIYYMEGGNKVTGWKQIGGDKYYFANDGRMQKRWLTLGDDTYYLGVNGKMVKGYQRIAGQSYLFDNEGRLQKEGEYKRGDTVYTIGSNGTMSNNSFKWFTDFINKYKNKKIDVDGNGVECVDLAKIYIHDVFGLQMIGRGDAKKYYLDFEKWSDLKATFVKIPASTPGFKVQQGDIIVWGGSSTGHIALVDSVGENIYKTWDQNHTNQHTGVTLVTRATYNNVLGVLRPIKQGKTR